MNADGVGEGFEGGFEPDVGELSGGRKGKRKRRLTKTLIMSLLTNTARRAGAFPTMKCRGLPFVHP
jgi:hypothetical protein